MRHCEPTNGKASYRLASIILTLLLVLGLGSTQALAESEANQAEPTLSAQESLIASETCGTASWKIDSDGVLTISSGTLEINTNNPEEYTDNYWPWCKYPDSITSVVISGEVHFGDNLKYMFYGCSKIKTLDLSDWDVSQVTEMQGMFSGCKSLETIDLTGWDTSNVTYMGSMFANCESLKSIDLSGFNTSSLQSTQDMFYECTSLETLDLSSWNTDSLAYPSNMFYACKALKSLNLDGWKMPHATSLETMFGECESLETLDLSSFDTSSVTNLKSVFRNCTSLKSVDVSSWDTSSVQTMDGLFFRCLALETMDLSNWNTSSNKRVMDLFYNCSSLTSVNLAGWDTSSVESIYDMFRGCTSLKSIDLSGWDTSAVLATTTRVFEDCTSLESITITSGFDVSKAFPDATNSNGWWSFADQRWYTVSQIQSDRLGIADTYTAYESSDGSISGATISSINDQAYTGQAITPEPTVTLSGSVLVEGTDYTLEYRNNVNAGTATIVITGIGLYDGTKSVTFTITPKALTGGAITLSSTSYTYDGKAKQPAVTLKLWGKTLAANSDYTVSYSSNTNAGTATATVTGKGNYVGVLSASFTIARASISGATVGRIDNQNRTGRAITPVPTVTLGGRTLSSGSDFTLSYANNVAVGTATITITGVGNYTGSKTATFRIVQSLLGLNDLSFSFSNSRGSFGYGSSYVIPLESYQTVFNKTLADYYYNYYSRYAWGGSCFGMTAASCMFNVDGSGLAVPTFHSTATKVSELSPYSTSSLNGKTLTRYIEALQVSQYSSIIGNARTATKNDLVGLVSAVQASKSTGRLVIVCIYGKIGKDLCGHAVVGYDYNPSQKRLYVYDPNYPQTQRYITLSTNSSGDPTGWYYFLNNAYNWGSGYSGSYINYSSYSDVASVWNSQGGTHLTNTLVTNSESFEVTDSEGAVVAKVEEGQLTKAASGVWQFIPQGVPLDGPEASSSTGVMLYLPSNDSYNLSNSDAGIGQLSVGMANVEQAAQVTTDATEVGLTVNDAEEINLVDVTAMDGESYEVALNSELKSAAGQEAIALSGAGTGATLSVGTVAGTYVSAGTSDPATVPVGAPGEGGAGVGQDISNATVTLTPPVYDYDGTSKRPRVKIVHDGKELVAGTDFIASYLRSDEMGRATVIIYGKGDYQGKFVKHYIIRAPQSITASGKTVQVGKTVSLGARARGLADLRYSSSNKKIATVNAEGKVKGIAAGKVTITIKAVATDLYSPASKTVTVIVKKANPMSAKRKTAIVRASLAKLKTKAQVLGSNITLKGAQGKVSYTNVSSNAKAKTFKVNAKTGKVTIPKKTKKGTYAIKVKVAAAGNGTYLPASKVITYKVVVK